MKLTISTPSGHIDDALLDQTTGHSLPRRVEPDLENGFSQLLACFIIRTVGLDKDSDSMGWVSNSSGRGVEIHLKGLICSG